MASKSLRGLNEAMRGLSVSSQIGRDAAASTQRIAVPSITRSMATEASPPQSPAEYWKPITSVPLTIFGFPSYEPQRLESWSTKHLNLPLRRDILHLAVVYEGDNTRQGTANTKNRWEVHGSHRKIRPQKGTGRARLGTKQSPLLRGGGKSFGPKPRDFGTKINRKVYDLAWRTALSYRYRRGELVVCEDGMELPLPEAFTRLSARRPLDEGLQLGFKTKWAEMVLRYNQWGREAGRSTFITTDFRDNLFEAIDSNPAFGKAMDVEDVDVKDLLTTGRLVVERGALQEMISRHQSDLVSQFSVNGVFPQAPESGQVLVG